MVGAIQDRTDQLAIREAVLIGGLFGWYGVDCIFQIAPPARRAAKSATILEPELWVQRCELRVTVSQRTEDDNILCGSFVRRPNRTAHETVARRLVVPGKQT